MLKETAVEFLRLARAGKRADAERLLAEGARHHNPYFKAGMDVLMTAIVEAAHQSPEGTMDVKHVLEDGDLVAVHSHVRQKPGDAGIAVVHLFRFENGLIAEFWDIGQQVPTANPNTDGMF
jgi:predicted SnoaL-like aldol condensation-catalyzing enzyme